MSFYNGAVYTKEKYNIKESVEEIMNEWNSQALREYKENVVLKPFVKEYLRELKDRGYKIGLATAALHDYYIPVLEREGVLDCFDVFTDTRDDARDKNFPDIYLLCAEKLGSNSANSIVFEDVLKGVKSSVSAGFILRQYMTINQKTNGKLLKILQTDTLWILVNYYIKIKECI